MKILNPHEYAKAPIWLILLSVTAITASAGCARDRDTRDYYRDELGERLAELQEVSAVYRGALLSKKTGAPLSSMSIRLAPNTLVSARNGNFENYQVPVLTGEIIINGLSKGALVISDSSYDPELKTFKTTIPVRLEAGPSVQVNVAANFIGDRMVGSIELLEYPEDGGSFELVKDGPLPDASALQGAGGKDKASQDDSIPKIYEGVLPLPSGNEQANLIIVRQNLRSYERVVDLLASVRYVDATLKVGDGNQFQFSSSQWDERLGTLTGETSSSKDLKLTLRCQEVAIEGQAERGLNCELMNNLRGVVGSVLFTPKKPAAGSGKSGGAQ